MKHSDELFQLIHSLEKHEKRFFKLFASIEEGDHAYLKIFDLIEKQKEYDEEQVVKQLGIQKNVFAVQKHFLFNLILNRVALLHSSKESDLRSVLTQTDILNKKGLFQSCEKLLRKAKAQAYEKESYGLLLEILRMLHINAWRKPNLIEADEIIEEEKKILALFNNQKQYTHLAHEIISLASDSKNKTNRKKLNQLVKHPFIVNEKNALTFHSKYTLFHTLYTYYAVFGNIDRQYHFAKKANELYEKKSEKIKINPLNYLFSLHNLISSCNDLEKFDEGKIYIDKLRNYSSLLKSEREKAWAFFAYHDNNSVYYIRTGKFEEGIESAEKLLSEMNRLQVKLDSKQSVLLYFDAAKIFFGAMDYKKSLACMNHIRNEKNIVTSQADIEASTRIFYLLIHYEKGNFDLLENIVKSELRSMEDTKRVFKIESVMLEFFGKKIQTATTRNEKRELFLNLKNELLLLEKDKKEKILMEQFDYISWVNSKINGRSLTEIIKGKYN